MRENCVEMSHFTCLQLPVVCWVHWNFFNNLCEGQRCGNYQKFTNSERGAKVHEKVSIYIMTWCMQNLTNIEDSVVGKR